jgi:Fur family transcriptional regulator, ferric uptake regulator
LSLSRTVIIRAVARKMQTKWADAARESLRQVGLRTGAARGVVIDFLDGEDCCSSAQEIHAELSHRGKSIGLASVYRILDELAAYALVQRVDFGDGVTRFEPLRGDDDHHHHLVCYDCGKVEAFSDARLESAIRNVERRSGYAVAAHDVVLRGACTRCRA